MSASSSAPVSVSGSNKAGKIRAVLHGDHVAFPEMMYTYPLKLLAPRLPGARGAAIVYMVSYGGGLVGGDRVRLDIDVGRGVKLLLLSQGSTKVFKTRPGTRAAAFLAKASDPNATETRQRLIARVAPGALLLLLPDPVTCFASAAYAQLQTLQLERGASAVLCDWYTSGRAAPPREERWAFARYASVNEVWVDGARVVRDATLLEQRAEGGESALEKRMGPYGCFASVLLAGPLVKDVCTELVARFGQESVFRVRAPPHLLWSISPVSVQASTPDPEAVVHVLRVAAVETEDVRTWLRGALSPLANVVGEEIYSKAFV
ncbi:unnamed protein product [Peniophora sp. CBMAI 1063]|nr:unnamed protein product [Peniophora sp. CBMAI 1063]